MKFLKGVSLFFIYPCILFGSGIYIGILLNNYFYPRQVQYIEVPVPMQQAEATAAPKEDEPPAESVEAASQKKEVINADTEYIVEEYDTRRDTLVETVWNIPPKYLGMDRDAFVTAMELYAASPPLSEQERGFVGLEVRSFSASRVVVRMNYAYVEPTKSFYLKVADNNIVVYCDDGETMYMYPSISALTLPEAVQTQVVKGMFIEDEAELYQFLETYSS